MKKQVVNLLNKNVSEIELSDSIFGIKVFPDLIHQYIRYQNAKLRQGSHKTKTRSEVNGRAKNLFHRKVQEMQGMEVQNPLILEECQLQWDLKIETILFL